MQTCSHICRMGGIMSVNIIAAECLFPSGPNLALADVALKTQYSLVKKHPFFVDRCGERIKASYFTAIKQMDHSRWQIMAQELLTNLAQKLAQLPTPEAYRLWLILPEAQRLGTPNTLESLLIEAVTKITTNLINITVLRGSHAQAAIALQEIMTLQSQYQENGHTIFDVVFSIDSYLMTETLMFLESEKLIHNSYYFDGHHAMQNPYGFIPSEGGAVIVITSALPGLCQLTAVTTSHEEHLRNMTTPCTGVALTQAARKVLDDVKPEKLRYVISDINGEPYRSDEYGFTLARLNTLLHDHYYRLTPVLATGDLGCASLPTHLALMAYQYQNITDPRHEQHILILSSSDDKLRSAVLLSDFNGIQPFNNKEK